MECTGVASGCGEQEAGVASGSGWNLWVWLLGVVVRRYIDFLILLIPTLVSVCSFFKYVFRSFNNYHQLYFSLSTIASSELTNFVLKCFCCRISI